MKLEFLEQLSGDISRCDVQQCCVRGETRQLTDVMLSAPSHLAPVPCCAATRDSLAAGFQTDVAKALLQHAQLHKILLSLGVRCHVLPAMPGMPDLCFVRDTVVTTPWGAVILAPALAHRRSEADHADAYLQAIGASRVMRIDDGSIEGGDICIAREGLLIIGSSGDRTTAAGVSSLGALFEYHGWEVLVSNYDPRHLHLDTIFCMLDDRTALAQLEALDPAFVEAVMQRGIALLPVTARESRELGCNILSIDGRTILMRAGHDRIERSLRSAGYVPIPVEISEFAACGGGVHCLTMPLARQ